MRKGLKNMLVCGVPADPMQGKAIPPLLKERKKNNYREKGREKKPAIVLALLSFGFFSDAFPNSSWNFMILQSGNDFFFLAIFSAKSLNKVGWTWEFYLRGGTAFISCKSGCGARFLKTGLELLRLLTWWKNVIQMEKKNFLPSSLIILTKGNLTTTVILFRWEDNLSFGDELFFIWLWISAVACQILAHLDNHRLRAFILVWTTYMWTWEIYAGIFLQG